jgi:predicted secreted protein with PEFG-CTERM motif
MAGTTFSVKFDDYEPGTYPYFCMVHPWMTGEVIVEEAAMHEEEHEEEVHTEGEATATGMLSDGTAVSIWTSAPTAGERMEISFEFADAEHVNHDLLVTQNGEVVLDETGAHHHEGKGVHETAPLSTDDPVEITITFQGYGVNAPFTGPVGEQVVFSNVVPEFGTIAVMILGVAIISIIAVTAKSRVIPKL